MCASTIGSGEEGAEPGEGGPCWEFNMKYIQDIYQRFFLKTLKREKHIFQTNFQPGLGTRAVSSAFSSHL